MTWRQVVPTTFTLAAMLSGFLSILLTAQGVQNSDDPIKMMDNFGWAAKLIMLAMILDGLDGNIARWLRGTSEFGAELDTYVDMTAFGIAPAILIFAVTLQSKDEVLRALLPSAVCVSGVVRLARFKVKDPLRGQAGYAGLPITANAGWVAMFVYLSTKLQDYFSLDHGPVASLFLLGVFVFIVLQVTNLRYPKPTKKASMFIPCIILVAALFVPWPNVTLAAAMIMIALGVLYIFIGPLFVKSMEAHKARKEQKLMANGNESDAENGSDDNGSDN